MCSVCCCLTNFSLGESQDQLFFGDNLKTSALTSREGTCFVRKTEE